jgi:two-component system, LuxR family, sensor kinase FixL
VSDLISEAIAHANGVKPADVRLRSMSAPASSWAMADRVQIGQVLLNLIRNGFQAVAEADERTVTVSGRDNEGDFVELEVSDTGPGLDPEAAERLFQPFSSSKQDGLGLGLVICRNVIEAHGGRIWVERTPGGGASFRFTLRRAAPP